MEKSKVEALLPYLNSKVTGRRGAWVLGHCPWGPWKHDAGKDQHPSFGIKSSTTKASICKCFSCGYGGDLTGLVFDLGVQLKQSPAPGYNLAQALQLTANEFEALEFDPNIPDYGEKKASDFVEYPAWWLATFGKVAAYPDAVSYLTSRMITPEMSIKLDLRYDPLQRRVCFPFWDLKGRLAGMQGRAIAAHCAATSLIGLDESQDALRRAGGYRTCNASCAVLTGSSEGHATPPG